MCTIGWSLIGTLVSSCHSKNKQSDYWRKRYSSSKSLYDVVRLSLDVSNSKKSLRISRLLRVQIKDENLSKVKQIRNRRYYPETLNDVFANWPKLNYMIFKRCVDE